MRRQLIREAMARTGTRWDVALYYDPHRDTLSQYPPRRAQVPVPVNLRLLAVPGTS